MNKLKITVSSISVRGMHITRCHSHTRPISTSAEEVLGPDWFTGNQKPTLLSWPQHLIISTTSQNQQVILDLPPIYSLNPKVQLKYHMGT